MLIFMPLSLKVPYLTSKREITPTDRQATIFLYVTLSFLLKITNEPTSFHNINYRDQNKTSKRRGGIWNELIGFY